MEGKKQGALHAILRKKTASVAVIFLLASFPVFQYINAKIAATHSC